MLDDVINEPVAETCFVRSADSLIKGMLCAYPHPQTEEPTVCVQTELLTARGELMANCGRYLLNVGAKRDQAAKKAIAKREEFAPKERIAIVEAETKGKFGKLEEDYREKLVKRKLYEEGALPVAKFPTAPSQAHAVPAPSQAHPATSSGAGAPTVALVTADELSVAHVYERLRIKGLGEEAWRLSQRTPSPL